MWSSSVKYQVWVGDPLQTASLPRARHREVSMLGLAFHFKGEESHYDSPRLLVRSVRCDIETQQGSQELNGIVVAELDRPLLIGLSGRERVVGITSTQDDVGSYSRGPIDLETVAVLLDRLNGDGIDALGGESGDGSEEGD
jgi:hypothetical protein